MRRMWLVPRSLSSFAALRRLRMTGVRLCSNFGMEHLDAPSTMPPCTYAALHLNVHLNSRYVLLVDLDEGVLAEAIDVDLVVALEGLVGDVFA